MGRDATTLPSAFPAVRARELNGRAELAIAEAASGHAARPARVTAILAALFEEVGEAPASAETLRRVSSAGREWLLQRASLWFPGRYDWFEAVCSSCETRFDVEVSLTDIPRAEPGAGFPVTRVETSLGTRLFEAPNGAHEESAAGRAGDDPRRVFAALCGLGDDAEDEAARFNEKDLALIDSALEAVSPDVADGVDALCPDCGAASHVRIDPLGFAFPRLDAVLGQIHLVASAYHWSEPVILDMPVARRARYARLISRDRSSGSRRPS